MKKILKIDVILPSLCFILWIVLIFFTPVKGVALNLLRTAVAGLIGFVCARLIIKELLSL